MARKKWHYVGDVGVDTGRIALVDPCYMNESQNADEVGCGSIVARNNIHLGLILSTQMGDGIFPVYVTKDDIGNTTEIKIDVRAFRNG